MRILCARISPGQCASSSANLLGGVHNLRVRARFRSFQCANQYLPAHESAPKVKALNPDSFSRRPHTSTSSTNLLKIVFFPRYGRIVAAQLFGHQHRHSARPKVFWALGSRGCAATADCTLQGYGASDHDQGPNSRPRVFCFKKPLRLMGLCEL